jgi:hypothetical protein
VLIASTALGHPLSLPPLQTAHVRQRHTTMYIQHDSWLRFYSLLGDEYNLSAPRSGVPGGGAGGGNAPAPAIFLDLRGRGGRDST